MLSNYNFSKFTRQTQHAIIVFKHVGKRIAYAFVGPLQLTVEEEKKLTELVKYAIHWRERQRAQAILWLSLGKKVAEIAELQS